jgi:hypothetical protein
MKTPGVYIVEQIANPDITKRKCARVCHKHFHRFIRSIILHKRRVNLDYNNICDWKFSY